MKSGSTFGSSNGLIEQNPRLSPVGGSRSSGVQGKTRKMSRTPDLQRGSKIVYLSFLPRTNGVLSTLGVVRDRFGGV